MFRLVRAGFGWSGQVAARFGVFRFGSVCLGLSRQGSFSISQSGCGVTGLVQVGHGPARQGKVTEKALSSFLAT